MSEMVTLWLVVLIVSIGVEVATLGLTSIWFAGGAVVAVIAAALQAPIWLQILLFFAVSLLLLFFTRPVAVRYFNKDRVRTNVESMIGRQAIVTSEIDNLQGIGQVTVGGQEWSARTEKDGLNLQPGTVVDIMAVSGVKLIVKVEPFSLDLMLSLHRQSYGCKRFPYQLPVLPEDIPKHSRSFDTGFL